MIASKTTEMQFRPEKSVFKIKRLFLNAMTLRTDRGFNLDEYVDKVENFAED